MTDLLSFFDHFKRELPAEPTEVDWAILAQLVYLPFNRILGDNDSTPLGLNEAARRLMTLVGREDVYTVPADRQLLPKLASSNRFKNVTISNCIVKQNSVAVEQFAALTIHLSKTHKVIAYRGTDGTIVGWREDCYLAFQTEVGAQISARQYLADALNQDDKTITIVGHSKGGNLGVYATITTPASQLSRIKQCINFDGPGFPDEVLQKYPRTKALDQKIITFAPELSFFGMIGEYPFQQTFVKSNGLGLWQHFLYTWRADDQGNFLRVKSMSSASRLADLAANDFVKNTTKTERQQFIDSVFNIFDHLPYNNVLDLIKNWNQVLKLVRNESKQQSPEARRLLEQGFGIILKSFVDNMPTLWKI